MNKLSPAVRKIIYIVAMVMLIIPLSFVSLPETRSGGAIKNQGGILSVLRDKHELSQANLSEIDPASETMKLASLGLRGIAVSTLWMQAMDHKKKEEYDQLASTLKALTKIQPNFVKVWEFQSHNLAYNVSMEFDDYEYRYHWVKQGIDFLKGGVPYNKTDHRMTDALGFTTGNKMGKSDEKESFRRMFGRDDEFHIQLSDMIDPDSYQTLGYGHGYDSWKLAYQWYDYSRKLVDDESARKRTSDMLFYMYRPAQTRNQGLSLQNEFRTNDRIQEDWRYAQEGWKEYGDEPMINSLGVTYTMEGIARNEKQIETYQKQLDELAPGMRMLKLEQVKSELNLPVDALFALSLPSDQRTDEQQALVRDANRTIGNAGKNVDLEIAASVSEKDQAKARRLVESIDESRQKIRTIEKDSETINYAFWRARTKAEASEEGVLARQALFDAEEMRRRSIYDDEFDRNYKTKEVTITKRGAISLYLDAFEKWNDVLKQTPELRSGPMSDDLGAAMEDFREMLETTNREWPENFPLQDLIDFRRKEGEQDKLPTSEELAEQRSALSDDGVEEESVKPVDDENTQAESTPNAKSDESKKNEPKQAESDKETSKQLESDKAPSNPDGLLKQDELKKDESIKDIPQKVQPEKLESQTEVLKKDDSKKDRK